MNSIITVVILSRLRNKALLDLLAQYPSGQYEPLVDDLPCKEIYSVETGEWCLVSIVRPVTKVDG